MDFEETWRVFFHGCLVKFMSPDGPVREREEECRFKEVSALLIYLGSLRMAGDSRQSLNNRRLRSKGLQCSTGSRRRETASSLESEFKSDGARLTGVSRQDAIQDTLRQAGEPTCSTVQRNLAGSRFMERADATSNLGWTGGKQSLLRRERVWSY